jgi:hypothetical protein
MDFSKCDLPHTYRPIRELFCGAWADEPFMVGNVG